MDIFLTKVDNLLNKYNTIMHKIKADADENLMTTLYTLKTFWRPKFIKRVQVHCKKVIRYSTDNLENSSDDSNKE